jgi:phage shock protein E
MKFCCGFLAGLVATVLAGCTDDSPKARGAAVADGPAEAAADGPAVPTNDVGMTADAPVARDANAREEVSDLPAPELAPADLRAVDRSPTPDPSAAETRATETLATDRQDGDGAGADGSAPDLPRAELAPADKPDVGDAAGNASGDGGCTGWTTQERLSPAEAKALIATADPIVINVHIPYEGDIPGTDVSIPYNDVSAIEKYLNYDHCADVLLVCMSGGMSQTAGNELIKRGYLRIRDIKGGMIAWEQAGYPLLKDGGP